MLVVNGLAVRGDSLWWGEPNTSRLWIVLELRRVCSLLSRKRVKYSVCIFFSRETVQYTFIQHLLI